MLQTTVGHSLAEASCPRHLTAKHLFFLTTLLDIRLFSHTVLLDPTAAASHTPVAEAPQNQLICSQLLPFLQAFLYYRPELRPVYTHLIQQRIHSELATLKFYTVDDLSSVYRSCHDPLVCVTVAKRTCGDRSRSGQWEYVCRSDASEKEVVKGFVRMLVGEEEKEVVRFCLLMQQFGGAWVSGEDRREIERDYGIRMELPTGEEAWLVGKVAGGAASQSLGRRKKLAGGEGSGRVYETISRGQINVPVVGERAGLDVEGLREKMRGGFEVRERQETAPGGGSEKQMKARLSLNSFVSSLDGNR